LELFLISVNPDKARILIPKALTLQPPPPSELSDEAGLEGAGFEFDALVNEAVTVTGYAGIVNEHTLPLQYSGTTSDPLLALYAHAVSNL
jgi:hypothetical protein